MQKNSHNLSILLFFLTLTGLFFLLASQSSWAKTGKSRFTFLNYDQFVVENILMDHSMYFPHTSLVLGKSSIQGWTHRLTNHFGYKEGEDVVLHFETIYHDDKNGVVYPTYALQLNLEIPSASFKNQKRIPINQIKGYLSWVHPDFPKGDLYLPVTKGHVRLWRIKKGYLTGHLNLKFEHPSLEHPIHVYGPIRAQFKDRNSFSTEQKTARARLRWEASQLDTMPVDRDRLKPRYDYKKRDPNWWIKKRDSSAWQKDNY